MKVHGPDDSNPERLTVSQLAARTRTSIPSIKFYVREGILRPGDLSAKHRAFYSGTHVRRLRLIRVLMQVGGLGMPSIRDVCKLLDAKGSRPIDTIIAHVIDSLGRRGRRRSVPTGPEAARAHRDVSQPTERPQTELEMTMRVGIQGWGSATFDRSWRWRLASAAKGTCPAWC